MDAAGGPGANYLEVSDALAVAVGRDTVLVRPGLYAGFEVAGKAVSVIAEGRLRSYW